jgi:hypothetical protein
MAPRVLTNTHQSLPAILHIRYQSPMSEYSKGSWGLSVLPRVTGIFTGITISPRSSLRQRPDRYTIRAGRNLPDKEFRYLRTVIVTADIHQGFGSKLLPKDNLLPSPFGIGHVSHPIHPLSSSQSAMFLINSRLGLFTAPPKCSNKLSHLGGPLLPKLRGHIAEFLNEVSLARLGILYHSTCVGLRYGCQ